MGFEERAAPPPKAPVVPPDAIDIKLPSSELQSAWSTPALVTIP